MIATQRASWSKIELAVQNSIFAENFDICCNFEGLNIDIAKYSMKKELLKLDYCSKDYSVAGKLKALFKRDNLYVPEYAPEAAKETEQEKKLDGISPRWKHLRIGEKYQVHIKHFENPNKFYVTVDDTKNQILRQLMKEVEDGVLIPLEEYNEGNLCLVKVKGEKAQRGLIIELPVEVTIKVFLLDAGEHIVCHNTDIFELPPSAINAISFQAVHCRLMGVKPKFGMGKWLKRSSKAFHDFLLEKSGSIKMQITARKGFVCDVVLYHPETGLRLDTLAVSEMVADAGEEFVVGDDDFVEKAEVDVLKQKKEVSQANQKKLLELLENEDTDFSLES